MPPVTARQIGSPDRAGKQCVAGDEQILTGEEKTDASRCVSGCMDDFTWEGVQADNESVIGTGVWRRNFGGGHAEPTGLHLHGVQEGKILLVEKHRRPGSCLEQQRSTDMIYVGMGNHDLAQGEIMLLQPGENLWNVVSRIDNDSFSCCLVTQDGAVTAEWTYRKDLQDHG